MNMPGTKQALFVIADADGLIALLSAEDANHQKAVATVEKLVQQDAQTIVPLSTILETVTTLKRKLGRTDLAEQVITQITGDSLTIEDVDRDMLNEALKVFDPKGSKQNTLFDAMVTATAKKHGTKVIFSMDAWYTKQGFTLAHQFVAKQEEKAQTS